MNIYIDMFRTFAKIGAFTLGGGYAMLSLIQAEVVDRKKWMTAEDFNDCQAVAQSAPGIFAANISIFVGYRLRGNKGAFVTTLGTVLPSFLIILLIAVFFHQFKDNEIIERMFKGIRPAVVALIAAPVFNLAKYSRISRYTIWIPVISALLIWLAGVNPVWIVMLAGIGGFIYGHYYRQEQKIEEETQAASATLNEAKKNAKEAEVKLRQVEAERKKQQKIIEEASRKADLLRHEEMKQQKMAEEAKMEASRLDEEERQKRMKEPTLFDVLDPRQSEDDNEKMP